MTDRLTGQYQTSSGKHIEHGMQPARVQYTPAPRPATSQIKPPPAPKK
ncbi:hypothetical protein [Plantibacter sp. CFBP 8804]|nr:hypothetical protein [Plantibacter sp. CFBP 8804]MBD8518896.1 hypothetical protein [Plantibacter sp. CFBP 8804]